MSHALSHPVYNSIFFNSNGIDQEGGDGPAYQQKCWDTGGGRGGSSC